MSVEHARLYYNDSYTTRFEAAVVERLAIDDRPAVVLDRSAFYPTSGGQPHDRGTLDGVTVQDVLIRESDGAVLHLVDRLPDGDRVAGTIDWDRRFDHMQQHTGQHVLSQAFLRLASAGTIGFHLGAEYVSIDLDVASLAPESVEAAFELAGRVVEADAPVRAWFPQPDELAALSLRKTPDVEGALRVVAIGDFDLSACGGTHVARTGEIGLIQHLRTERLKRGTRVAFLCGRRARRDYSERQAITAALSARLTCSVGELPDAVARLEDQVAALRRDVARFREAELEREAALLRGAAGAPPIVVRAWDGRPAAELRALAQQLTIPSGVLALLGTAGIQAQFVFGRSEDLDLNLKPALDAALAAIGGGRGGGGRLVQGGGGPATLDEVERALAAAAAAIAR